LIMRTSVLRLIAMAYSLYHCGFADAASAKLCSFRMIGDTR
jgi:hypothetical protein